MTQVTYGLYLSTTSNLKSLKPYYSVDTSVAGKSQNNVKWNINWREIFGSEEGECRVRVKLISRSKTNLTWTANTGSVRASFASNYQNSTNGFNLGPIVPEIDTTADWVSTSRTVSGVTTQTTTNTTYLTCDTSSTLGASMIIPKTNTDLNICIYNGNETAMENVPDYQIWLYFDVVNVAEK